MAALSRTSKNVCRAIRKELYFIYFSLLVKELEGWPQAVLWYYYLVPVVLVCSENRKKWAHVMFVNVACDLVLFSKVQKVCHRRSSLFSVCGGVTILKTVLTSLRGGESGDMLVQWSPWARNDVFWLAVFSDWCGSRRVEWRAWRGQMASRPIGCPPPDYMNTNLTLC